MKMQVQFKTKRDLFKLTISGKYTIIYGDSGAGKTLLMKYLTIYTRSGMVGMSYSGPGKIYGYFRDVSNNYHMQEVIDKLQSEQGSLFIFDETYIGFSDKEFLSVVKKSQNYFLIITRDGISSIPYGLFNIFYYVRTSKHVFEMQPVVRSIDAIPKSFVGAELVCEDKGIGFQCVEIVFCKYNYTCVSLQGKDNLARYLECNQSGKTIFILDLCGLSRCSCFVIDKIIPADNYCLVNCLSFECTALSNPVILGSKWDSSIFEQYVLKMESEEYFYTLMLTTVLKKKYDRRYDKVNGDISSLLCTGHTKSGTHHIGSDAKVLDDTWLYPDIPRKSITEKSTIKKMELK